MATASARESATTRCSPGPATDDFTIRRATRPKSLRITWKDGTSHVDMNIYARGEKRSQVAVQHGKLTSAQNADQMKKYWRDALTRLERELT